MQKYKELGGKYKDDDKPNNLASWFKEKWGDIGNKEYPVYRPTKRINDKTPLTASEIDKKQLKDQIELKHKIRGGKHLPIFKSKY